MRGDDLIGHDVNLASRLTALAAPGEVLATDALRAAVGEGAHDLEFESLGPVFVKGIADPVRVWSVTRCA